MMAKPTPEQVSFFESKVRIADGVDESRTNLLFDAQTSGGLLIAVTATDADALLDALHQKGVVAAALIGEVTQDDPGRLFIKP